MAFIMGDSFDLAANTSALVSSGLWTATNGGSLSATTRFSFGQSLYLQNGAYLIRDSMSPSANTVFFAFALYVASGSAAHLICRDGGLPQVTVSFNADGSISVHAGNFNGSVIATFSSAYSLGIWNHFQVQVVVHPSDGEVRIRKNGDTANSFAATGLNTRSGTSNNYLTGAELYAPSGSTAVYADDFLMYDNSGATPNTWVGDVRCYVLYPAANTSQRDFTPNPIPTVLSSYVNYTFALSANVLYMSKGFVFAVPGVLNSATLSLNAGFTGNMNVALYDSSGATVIATATAIANPVTGLNTFTFSSPPAVTAGATYRVAVLADSAVTLLSYSAGAGFYSSSHSYGSGFPTSPTNSAGSQKDFYLLTVTTPPNYFPVADAGPNDGDLSFNYSSTVNAEDLYTLQPLPSTPASIAVAQLRLVSRKSDSGARSAETVLVSGGTTDYGASTLQSSSYTHQIKAYPVDPNTSAAWTAAAINALTVGVKISS